MTAFVMVRQRGFEPPGHVAIISIPLNVQIGHTEISFPSLSVYILIYPMINLPLYIKTFQNFESCNNYI